MRVDPDGKTALGITSFLGFVALNVLYLLCCVPVVTIGAATSALDEVMLRYIDDERGRPLVDYLPTLRADLRRGTAVTVVLLVPAAMLLLSGLFWYQLGGLAATAAGTVAFVGAAYLLVAFRYACALVAAYRTPLRATVRNAMLLPGAEPVRTVGIVLIPVTFLSVAVVMPTFLVVLGTVAFSVGAYASAFLFRSVFSRHGT